MREPLNLKLLFLYLLKKVWILLCGTILFALVFGGVYYLKNYVFAPAPQYVATSQLYLTYADDVRLENVYINDYTWQILAATDACLDEVKKLLPFEADDAYLKSAATAGLESDVRLVTVTVTAESPERAVTIANAYEIAIQKLGEKMVDVDEVQIFSSAKDAVKKEWDNRTLRMSVTGAVVGFAFTLMILLFAFAVDDSVYLPETMEIRYDIPTLYVFDKQKNSIGSFEKAAGIENIRKVLHGKQKVYLSEISVEKDLNPDDAKAFAAKLSENGESILATEALTLSPEIADTLRNSDGVIVLVKAGAGNGKIIERSVRYLKIQEIPILGAVLYDVNKVALGRYQKPVK